MKKCRWCKHESIVTEDVSSLVLGPGINSQEAAQRAAQAAQMASLMKACSKCGAYNVTLTGGQRPDGAGFAIWANPDGSVYFETWAAGGKVGLRWVLPLDLATVYAKAPMGDPEAIPHEAPVAAAGNGAPGLRLVADAEETPSSETP